MFRSGIALITVGVLVSTARCRMPEALPGRTGIPVRLEVAKRSEFAPSMTLIGVVRAQETIPLLATSRGIVTFAHRFAGGLRTGEHVAAGELLAEVRNEQVMSQVTQTRLQMEVADADFARAKRSREQGIISVAEYSGKEASSRFAHEAFRLATSDAEHLRIVAPRAGILVVAQPPIAGGTAIEGGAKLGEIITSNTPVVESSVAASQRKELRPGLAVELTAGVWKGTGMIREVASVIDQAGTARVVVSMDSSNPPPPGTGVDLIVQLPRRPDVLTLPEEAIVAGGDGPAVFVVGGSEGFNSFRVKRVGVVTGGRANGRTEILSGIRDGDRVVVVGAGSLSDGASAVEVPAEKGSGS